MAYDLLHIFNRLRIVPANVILVGAWQGREVKDFLEAGVQRAYFSEAEPNAIKLLTESYGHDVRVHLFEGAIASESGQVLKFHILNHGSSSLLSPNLNQLKKILPDFEVESEIQVHTITLDSSLQNHQEYWGENKLGTLLILDIPGGELEALKGAPELLKRVGWIQSEVSTAELYQDQNTLAQLDKYLKGKGFNRVSTRIYPEKSHGDALYFRPKLLTKSFLVAMRIEDLHWNLARKKPAWIPSLSHYKTGRFVLRLIYGK